MRAVSVGEGDGREGGWRPVDPPEVAEDRVRVVAPQPVHERQLVAALEEEGVREAPLP